MKTLPYISFMRFSKVAGALSFMFFVGTFALLILRGLNFGIDFTGGTLVQLQTDAPYEVKMLRSATTDAGLNGLTIQGYGADNEFLIRAPADSGKADKFAIDLKDSLAKSGITSTIRRVEFVGPQIGGELKEKGLAAIGVALIAVLIYVSLRFEFSFGVGTIAALIHDVTLTVGVFSLLQMELGLTVLAGILTIIGYSLNDTIVIFDRVRENRRRYRKMGIHEVIDRSLNETMRRTLMTSFTTLVAVLALYFLGGEVIRDFAFTLTFGVIVGTYSSIFVAAPIYRLVDKRTQHWFAETKDAKTGETE